MLVDVHQGEDALSKGETIGPLELCVCGVCETEEDINVVSE